MNRRATIALLAATLGLALTAGFAPQEVRPLTTPAAAATYKIDPVHSTAIFRVHHLGAGQFYGRFNDVQGTFTFAERSNAGLSFDVTIPIESVDTNNDDLDQHLKSPDFFNARDFPEMTFKTSSARKVNEHTYEISGGLTIHGVTQPITTEVTWTGTKASRGVRCGFEAIFEVKRSDFGMMFMVENNMLGDSTRLIVSLEGVKQ